MPKRRIPGSDEAEDHRRNEWLSRTITLLMVALLSVALGLALLRWWWGG